jgi:hypothetical protein
MTVKSELQSLSVTVTFQTAKHLPVEAPSLSDISYLNDYFELGQIHVQLLGCLVISPDTRCPVSEVARDA